MINKNLEPQVREFAKVAFGLLGTPIPEIPEGKHTPRWITTSVHSRLTSKPDIDRLEYYRELFGESGLKYPNPELIAQGLKGLELVPWFSGPQPVDRERLTGLVDRLYQYSNSASMPTIFVNESEGFALAHNHRNNNHLPVSDFETRMNERQREQVVFAEGLARAVTWDQVESRAGGIAVQSTTGNDARDLAAHYIRHAYLHPEFSEDPSMGEDFHNLQGFNHLQYNPGRALMEIAGIGYWPIGEVTTTLESGNAGIAFAICTYPMDKQANKEKMHFLGKGMTAWEAYVAAGRRASDLLRMTTRVLETPRLRFSLS